MNARTMLICVDVMLFCAIPAAQHRQVPPLMVDYARGPDSLEEALETSDLVAVVRVTGRRYKDSVVGMPTTDFDVQVIEVLSNPKNLLIGSTIVIHRAGGLVNINGVEHVQEEYGFPAWPLGLKLVVFLGWSEEHQVFYPRSGREFVFEEDQKGRIRSHGRGVVAGSYRGRPFSDVVASIKGSVR